MPAVGDILGDRYRIDARLGAGGMATVHRAHDIRLARDVAVKILLPNMAGDPVLAERFDREARALASIRHANIVAVHDVEPGDPVTGREPFFVMELCEGGSLADRLNAAGGALPPDEVVPIVVAVATGLAELHANGIVHRDVKPHNMLLGAGGAKLGDFGVARSDSPDSAALTTVGSTVGTLAYLAPEQLVGEPATPATDVYALGVVAYQALTGALPHPTTGLAGLLEARSTPVPPLSAVRPELGDAFDAPVAAALAADPSARPDPLAFGGSLAGALGRWSRRRPQPAPVPTPVAAPLPAVPADDDAPTIASIPVRAADGTSTASEPTQPRRDPGLPTVVVLGAGLLALILLLGVFAGSGNGPSASPSGAIGGIASVPPSPSPSPSPSPPSSPTPAQDPLDAAISRVRSAIENASGGPNGLKGKDANSLRDRLGSVERQLNEGDLEDAGKAAEELVDRVRELVDKKEVTGDRATELLAAARALREAIPEGD